MTDPSETKKPTCNNRKETIFPVGSIFIPRAHPVELGAGLSLFTILFLGANAVFFKMALKIIGLIAFVPLSFVAFKYYEVRKILKVAHSHSVDWGDFNFSKNHIFVLSDGMVIATIIIFISWITLLFLFISDSISCGISGISSWFLGLCSRDVYHYEDNLKYGRALHHVLIIFYFLFFPIIVKIMKNRFECKRSEFNITYFTYISHYSSGLLSLYIVLAALAYFLNQYIFGAYTYDMGISTKSKSYMAFLFVYFGAYPIMYVFSVKFVSHFLFVVGARSSNVDGD